MLAVAPSLGLSALLPSSGSPLGWKGGCQMVEGFCVLGMYQCVQLGHTK